MKTLANELAPHMIRVNSVNPTQVATPMIMNEVMMRLFVPDSDNPTDEQFAAASQTSQALAIPWVESIDVSNAVLFLASDEARYITGVALPVDAGALVK
jgi:(+)-trans-carveol dehydrogenase